MLENDSNKKAKNITSKKNKYANQNLMPFSDYNISNYDDIKRWLRSWRRS